MPQHTSAKRRVRLSEKEKMRNRANRTKIKNVIKGVREAETGEEAAVAYTKATQTLDKLAAKGVIHKNKAANQKSRLSRVVASLKK